MITLGGVLLATAPIAAGAPMTAPAAAYAGAAPGTVVADQPTIPSGPVPAAEVGAPAGSNPEAPALPIVEGSVEASSASGTILTFGDAPPYGSLAGQVLAKPITAMAATPTGHGYWLVAADGGIFTFGDAGFHGSTGATRLNQPIVGMAPTPTGNGYWLVAADGGIFTFGDAALPRIDRRHPPQPTHRRHGPHPDRTRLLARRRRRRHLHLRRRRASTDPPAPSASTNPSSAWPPPRPATATGSSPPTAASSPSATPASTDPPAPPASTNPSSAWPPPPPAHGYWLVAADGGIFTFGDAGFYGSAAGQALVQPVVGIAAPPGGGGYWLVEGQRASNAASDVFSEALTAALGARAGVVSASVLDLTTGDSYQYRPGQLGITASIVKVEILGTLLSEAQAEGRGLTATEEATATSMIEVSDNDSATALWDEVGGAPAVAAFDRSVGMTSTTPSSAWGLTETTTADQIDAARASGPAEPRAVGRLAPYEIGLMEHVTPSQAWGVSAGIAPGTIVALKNGWLAIGSGWVVNSVGWVDGGGRDYLIAVTASGDPSMGYGIDSISMVAAR